MGFFIDNFKYKTTLIGNESILIEGHRGITSFRDEEVIVRVRGGSVKVNGRKLIVEEINGEEVLVKGSITTVEVQV